MNPTRRAFVEDSGETEAGCCKLKTLLMQLLPDPCKLYFIKYQLLAFSILEKKQ